MARIPEFGAGGRFLWRVCWPIARLLSLWFPYSVERQAPLPTGPFVAAVNHYSHLDPPFAGLALRRPMRFLALDELWGHSWILDRALRVFGAIPLPRLTRRPVAAVRAALRELERGGAVGVFPEGRRVGEWGDAELKPGAAWLSLRTGAKLVPVAVWGTKDSMPIERLAIRRAPIRVVIAPPIDPADHRGADDPIGSLTEAWRIVVDRELAAMARAAS